MMEETDTDLDVFVGIYLYLALLSLKVLGELTAIGSYCFPLLSYDPSSDITDRRGWGRVYLDMWGPHLEVVPSPS